MSRIKKYGAWLAMPLLLALAGCPPATHGDDDSSGDDDSAGDDDAGDDDTGDDDTQSDYGPQSDDGSAPLHPELVSE